MITYKISVNRGLDEPLRIVHMVCGNNGEAILCMDFPYGGIIDGGTRLVHTRVTIEEVRFETE